MKLSQVLQAVPVCESSADGSVEITGVVCDSRKVQKGNLFVAVDGCQHDGNRYIAQAMENGAAAVVTAKKPKENIPWVLVASDRAALARISANFYGHPARELIMVGVTGTNGKTSVTSLCKQVLEQLTGEKVGLVGTMENCLGDRVQPAQRTTPESPELQKILYDMRAAGCRYAVMEVSSHGLHQQRVGGICFRVAAFTNLTADHLDYHKTMEDYCAAKAMLFASCHRAVVNADDPWHTKITENCHGPVLRLSARGPADLYGENICLEADGVCFTAVCGSQREAVKVPIPGNFTVYNALTVLGIALQLGFSLEAAARALENVRGVRGRVEVVPTPGKPYKVMIDYAHTPDGLANVLASLRDFCKGRLIALFGCGGDRDKSKRPQMGKIGVSLADIAIITSDNPRTEDPKAIISDILQGVGNAENYIIIENRTQAIQYAMDIGQKDDIIVLCGKGHETHQLIGRQQLHFDEREIVRKFLKL